MLEEEEDDDIIHLILNENGGNRPVHNMFRARSGEGLNTILINRHLMKDERKFREFFSSSITCCSWWKTKSGVNLATGSDIR
jgi:hypothetical protein